MVSTLEAALEVAFAEWAGWTRNSSQISVAVSRLHSLDSCGRTSALKEDKKNVKEGGIRLKADSLSGIVCLTQPKTKLKALNTNLDARLFGF